MRFALALLIGAAAFAQDAKEIVRRSVDQDLLNFERLKNYTYTERDEVRSYDPHGKVSKTAVQTYEVLILGGRDYERLVGRDDKPLPEKDARKEQEKLDKEAERRQHESAGDKAKHEKERLEDRKFLHEVTDAFDFKLTGEELVSGKPAWAITAEPKPDYHPKDRRAKIVTKLRGRIWIDKGEYQWVKVDAEAIGKMTFGLRMVQIEPGATLQFEQKRVNDEIWLPASAKISLSARLLFLKRLRAEVEITFSQYKKFQADSRILSEEGP